MPFKQILPGDLKPVSIMAQALDNQWVPTELLNRIFKRNRSRMPFRPKASLSSDWVRKERERLVRAEYVRALVNSDQIVVNRAYIYNNHAVIRDYERQPVTVEQSNTRNALKQLLSNHVIVPFLYTENDPTDPPPPQTAKRQGFGTIAFEAWKQLCGETDMQCVRLSWDGAENSQLLSSRMNRRFHMFAETAWSGDEAQYIRDLKLQPSDGAPFMKRLEEVGDFATRVGREKRGDPDTRIRNSPLVTRNELYLRFVTQGENTAEGVFHGYKPFAKEIKQLIDLAYNTYLPDALGGYPLTPFDSLTRLSLQEYNQPVAIPTETTEEQLLEQLRQVAFALTQQGLYLRSMDLLTLPDVLAIRSMDEWSEYLKAMESLLRNPFSFADPQAGVRDVGVKYARLMERASTIIEQRYVERKTQVMEAWTPLIELVFTVGGSILTLTGHPTLGVVVKAIPAPLTKATEQVIGKLVIRGLAEEQAQADLANSIVFLKAQMRTSERTWQEVVGKLKDIYGKKDDVPLIRQEAATINQRAA